MYVCMYIGLGVRYKFSKTVVMVWPGAADAPRAHKCRPIPYNNRRAENFIQIG